MPYDEDFIEALNPGYWAAEGRVKPMTSAEASKRMDRMAEKRLAAQKSRIKNLIRNCREQENPPGRAWYYRGDFNYDLLEEGLQRVYGFARPSESVLEALQGLETNFLLYKSPKSTLWAKLLALRGIDVACDMSGEFMEGDPKNRELDIPFLHIRKEPLQEFPERPRVIYAICELGYPSLRGYLHSPLATYQNYQKVMKLVRWNRA